jgi:transcription antitermination factor NusG
VLLGVTGSTNRRSLGRLEKEIGATVYLPLIRERSRYAGKPIIVPLYKTYLFADIDASPTPWQAIKRHPGVITVVMAGENPGRCPDTEIAKLKAAEIDGLVRLVDEPPPPTSKRLAAGQRVRIGIDAFAGKEAAYVRPARQNMSVVTVVLLSRAISASL